MKGTTTMQGCNEIRLNAIEMQTAVQEYLDARFKTSPGKVKSVNQTPQDNWFVVKIEGPVEKQP